MLVAQVIQFDARQAIGRPQRRAERAPCIVLRFPTPKHAAATPAVLPAITDDADRTPGRGRDPG